MKSMKKLIPAIAMLIISAVLLSTASYAWFSMNKVVTATGMQVEAKASSSLIITKLSTEIPNATSTQTTLTPPEGKITLIDVTHISGDDTWTTYSNGLKTVTNRHAIDPTNGKAAEYTWGPVANNEGTSTYYYVDYVVYIASKDAEMTGQKIKATIGEASGAPGFKDAVAVDFYIGESASGDTYKGTSHAGDTDGVVLSLDEEGTIPKAAADGFLTVTMRVYIDGAVDTVNTNNYDAGALGFDVTFEAQTITP